MNQSEYAESIFRGDKPRKISASEDIELEDLNTNHLSGFYQKKETDLIGFKELIRRPSENMILTQTEVTPEYQRARLEVKQESGLINRKELMVKIDDLKLKNQKLELNLDNKSDKLFDSFHLNAKSDGDSHLNVGGAGSPQRIAKSAHFGEEGDHGENGPQRLTEDSKEAAKQGSNVVDDVLI